jgi:tripartite-type tricarboxylate transporter receptor subunit TctC
MALQSIKSSFQKIKIWQSLTFTLCALVSSTALAQSDFPKQKPINFIVATGPGSSTDSIARLVAAKLTETLGWNVVVENKLGASGNIACVYVKRSNPDGYSILVHSVSFAINPSIYKNAGYDAINDFEPVALGASSPNVIGINMSIPVNNLKELVNYGKKEKLSYSSSGIGTTTHLTIERFKNMTNSDFVHAPYQPAQAVGATVAGHTQISSTSMPPTIPFIKAGKLKALAVTSAQRSAALPDVPTMAEQGFPEFDDTTWFGFFSASKTPPDVLAKLNAEINRAIESKDVKEKLTGLGLDTKSLSPSEFKQYVKAEVPKWARAVKESGATAE